MNLRWIRLNVSGVNINPEDARPALCYRHAPEPEAAGALSRPGPAGPFRPRPATVTTTDGATIPVTVHIQSRQVAARADWHGTLAAPGPVLLNVHEGRLRLPDGHESGFVRTAGGVPGGPIRVEGGSGEELL